ncbi:MAG: hypothetical protein IJR83_00350 [Clostridia bacterium]|nr:hypothetical protein [Clostridia bacterium]
MLNDFSKSKFDILIHAGQSNAAGCGVGSVKEPYCPNDKVWYLLQDFNIAKAAEYVQKNDVEGNFSLSFVDAYRAAGLLAEDRKILIVRSAVGGTGFRDHHWGLHDDYYLQMLEMIDTALALNPENRIVGLLWHQGETDAALNATYDEHYNNLSTLLKSVTQRYHVPTLPFVAADFVQNWKRDLPDICKPVVDAIRAVCADYSHGAFVETDGLLSNKEQLALIGRDYDDTIHFSRESLYELGRRYFAAFQACLS